MVSAVPERIRHAFLHVRDYAKMHRGSLQIDFMQTIKPRSVPVVLFLPHHTAPISSSHFLFRQMQHNFGFVYVGSRKQAIDVKIVDESRVLHRCTQVLRPGHGYGQFHTIHLNLLLVQMLLPNVRGLPLLDLSSANGKFPQKRRLWRTLIGAYTTNTLLILA